MSNETKLSDIKLIRAQKTKINPATRNYQIMQIASGMIMGQTRRALADELGISYDRVKALVNSDDCKALMEKMTDSGQRMAQAIYAGRMPKLMEKALEVVEEMLDKKDPQTAMFVIKMSVDMDKNAPAKEGDTTIQIVMPNSKPKDEDSITFTTTANTLKGDGDAF